MSSKHTPGPWQLLDTRGVNGAHIAVVGYAKTHGSVICRVGGNGGDTKPPFTPVYPEDEANARLIAAAPDLLAVAEMALDYARADCTTLLADAAEEAIASAIGGKADSGPSTTATSYYEAVEAIRVALENNAAPFAPIPAMRELARDGSPVLIQPQLLIALLEAHTRATENQQ